jgi:hypothetical protein
LKEEDTELNAIGREAMYTERIADAGKNMED